MRLVAKAYIPICEGTRDLIAMLDGGIKKEVSVGCGIEECVCSICGEDMRTHSCGHVKGERYGDRVCCGVLKNPSDAYEWSFTAIPAQRRAGVIKSFFGNDEAGYEERFSESSQGGVVSIEEYNRLKSYAENLKEKAEESRKYKTYLELETVKSGITAKVGIESDLLENMVKGLNVSELLRLKGIFEKKAAEVLPVKSQLAEYCGAFGERKYESLNNQFDI